jgi:hypothetical protein
MRNGNNERMDSTGPVSSAVNQVPGSGPGHPAAGLTRQALRAPVTGRALRELAFCAIEGPLGLSVLAAVVALSASGLLASRLTGGAARPTPAHPSAPIFLLVLRCVLVQVPIRPTLAIETIGY